MTIDSERARRLAWLALWVYIGGLGISAVLRLQGDFFVYYRTGHRVLHGMAIYPPDDSDRFLYAPVFAIAFAPFALLPRHVAQGLWFVFNAWGLIAFVVGSGVMLFGRARRLPATLLAVPVLLSFRFIGNNIEHGQINLPVLALCVWSIVYAREHRPAWSGGMLAAAVLIKPFAMLAGLYLALRQKWSALICSIIVGVILFLIPIVVFGPAGLIDQTIAYLRSVQSMTAQYRTMLTNQSAVSAIARLMERFVNPISAEGEVPFEIGMAGEIILVALVCVWTVGNRSREENESVSDRYVVAAFFSLMPAFAAISWRSYFAALIVPYMLLTDELWVKQRSAPLAWALFIASVVMNFAPGRHLGRIALFYSANFLSSILVLAAVASLYLHAEPDGMASISISAQAERKG